MDAYLTYILWIFQGNRIYSYVKKSITFSGYFTGQYLFTYTLQNANLKCFYEVGMSINILYQNFKKS